MLKDKIVALCQNADVTMKKMILDLGFTEQSAYRWFKEDNMEIKNLQKIADYFKVDIKYFFGEAKYVETLNTTIPKLEDPPGHFSIVQDKIKDKYIAVLEENARLLRELGECREKVVRYEAEKSRE